MQELRSASDTVNCLTKSERVVSTQALLAQHSLERILFHLCLLASINVMVLLELVCNRL
jgi:hypothetical protein